MKIALLTDGIYPYVLGGMQRHSFYLCKYLLQAGVHVDLYHTQWEKSTDIEKLEVFTEEEKVNLRSFVIPWPKENGLPGHYIRASHAYSRGIYDKFIDHSWDADFIYAKGFAAWRLLEEKKKGLKIAPIGLKLHGYEMYQLAPSFKIRLQYWLLRGPVKWNTQEADYVFSYGGKITDIIRTLGISDEHILEIPSGIEQDWVSAPQKKVNTTRRFVFLGRYERRKGIEEIFEVLQNIPDKDAFEFHFIGPIPEHLQVKGETLHYHGKVFDSKVIRDILSNSDVLVCPSYSEGMPNVILEAMASGLAIIASDVGAVSSMVDDSNGLLIRPANKEDLLSAMEKILAMPEKDLLQMKNVSIQKIKDQFLWPKLIQQLLRKIKKINSTSIPTR